MVKIVCFILCDFYHKKIFLKNSGSYSWTIIYPHGIEKVVKQGLCIEGHQTGRNTLQKIGRLAKHMRGTKTFIPH